MNDVGNLSLHVWRKWSWLIMLVISFLNVNTCSTPFIKALLWHSIAKQRLSQANITYCQSLSSFDSRWTHSKPWWLPMARCHSQFSTSRTWHGRLDVVLGLIYLDLEEPQLWYGMVTAHHCLSNLTYMCVISSHSFCCLSPAMHITTQLAWSAVQILNSDPFSDGFCSINWFD